jgi:hypothetical protein
MKQIRQHQCTQPYTTNDWLCYCKGIVHGMIVSNVSTFTSKPHQGDQYKGKNNRKNGKG